MLTRLSWDLDKLAFQIMTSFYILLLSYDKAF